MKILSAITIVLLLALSGCGKKAEDNAMNKKAASETAAEAATKAMTGADVDIQGDGGTVKMNTDKGTVTVSSGDGAKVPDGFPKDVPIYSGAKIVTTADTPDGMQVSLQSSDTTDAVVKFYQAQMKEKGWTAGGSANMGAMTMLSFKNGEREVAFQVMSDGKVTTINIIAKK